MFLLYLQGVYLINSGAKPLNALRLLRIERPEF